MSTTSPAVVSGESVPASLSAVVGVEGAVEEGIGRATKDLSLIHI
jgi:hypothetical protein